MFNLKKYHEYLKGGKSIPPLTLFSAHGNGLWVAQDGMGVLMGKESLKHGQIVGQFMEKMGKCPFQKNNPAFCLNSQTN